MKTIKNMLLFLAAASVLLCGCSGNDNPDGGDIKVRKGLIGEYKIPSKIIASKEFKEGDINIFSMKTAESIFEYSATLTEQSTPTDFQNVCAEFNYDNDVMFACGNYTITSPFIALGGEFLQISLKALSDFNNEISQGADMMNYSTLYALTTADIMQNSNSWPVIHSSEDNKLYGRRIPALKDMPAAQSIAWSAPATIALPLEIYIHINAKPTNSGKYPFELAMMFNNSICGKYMLKSTITIEWK